ncbi:hypothetical protein BH23ACT9_BH23ACT9_33160 [soil metagenome]
MQLGTWVKAGSFVGIVAKVEDDGTVVLFNPGDRQMLRATPGTLQRVPTGTVRVQVGLDVEVPHGLGEDSLKRWLAALVDPVLRARAQESLAEEGLDGSPFAHEPSIDVTELRDGP